MYSARGIVWPRIEPRAIRDVTENSSDSNIGFAAIRLKTVEVEKIFLKNVKS